MARGAVSVSLSYSSAVSLDPGTVCLHQPSHVSSGLWERPGLQPQAALWGQSLQAST